MNQAPNTQLKKTAPSGAGVVDDDESATSLNNLHGYTKEQLFHAWSCKATSEELGITPVAEEIAQLNANVDPDTAAAFDADDDPKLKAARHMRNMRDHGHDDEAIGLAAFRFLTGNGLSNTDAKKFIREERVAWPAEPFRQVAGIPDLPRRLSESAPIP